MNLSTVDVKISEIFVKEEAMNDGEAPKDNQASNLPSNNWLLFILVFNV